MTSRDVFKKHKDLSAKEGCGIMVLAILALIVFSVLMISGLAVLLMFGWGLAAPHFDAQPLDFVTAFGISFVIYIISVLVRK